MRDGANVSPILKATETGAAVPSAAHRGRHGNTVPFARASRIFILALLGAALPSGCGREQTPSLLPTVHRDPNVLVAYVACSLVPAMEVARAQFESEYKGKSVTIDSAQPSELMDRIRSGAIPDVFVCPSDAEIGVLEREGFLDRKTRQPIASLRLAIALPADSSADISSYRDLASSQVTSITMSTFGITSLGTDAKQALERAGVWSEIQHKLILQATPLDAVKLVAEGEADATFVYDPCCLLQTDSEIPFDSLRIVSPEDADAERSRHVLIVVHKRSPNLLLAQRFIRLVSDESMRSVLTGVGLPTAPEPQADGEAPD
jgi:molybdate transport system substrate-binding protein